MGNEGLMSGLNRLITEFRANTLANVELTGSENEVKDLPEVAFDGVVPHWSGSTGECRQACQSKTSGYFALVNR